MSYAYILNSFELSKHARNKPSVSVTHHFTLRVRGWDVYRKRCWDSELRTAKTS